MGKRSTAHTPGRSRRAKANQADAVGPAQPSLVPAVVAHLPSIIEHDGSFFWRATETDALVGPFKTMKAAIANRDSPDALDEDSEAGDAQALLEAESEIGIDDFIDPDTGEPSHGYEPHLTDDH